ncbi:MAG: amylo-alpha-1,6-glucosidase [Chloroflexota bacterium]
MTVDFGREVCGYLPFAERREWLVTNGMGGYASGTVAGLLTRRYHGLLMAALMPPVGRTLLVAKIDETVEYDGIYPENGRFYNLYLNRWSNGEVEAEGHCHINRFRLEGTIPVWTYGIANALLEKRIWMEQGANTTYVQYRLTRATGPLTLTAKAFVNHRDYHATTILNSWQPVLTTTPHGLGITLYDGAPSIYLLSDKATITPQFDWYEDFFLTLEEHRGQNDVEEDHIYAGQIQAVLQPGESLTLVASTDAVPDLDGEAAYARRRSHEKELLDQVGKAHIWAVPAPVQQLVLASDQFLVRRETEGGENGRSVLAGYHWFSDWGRDTMIALPGLALATGRYPIAAKILRTYAHFLNQGMLPNHFPDTHHEPEYKSVDASLWYIQAVRAYYSATSDEALLEELYPVLEEILHWYRQGTRYNIQLDSTDGLLYAGQEGSQLTWMDVIIDDWVVTPRIGKPIEVSALWYNAQCIMADFARQLNKPFAAYEAAAAKTKAGFARFWNADMGYCYDVLDTPHIVERHDGRLRPNQLFAVSLPHSPLSAEQQKSVVDACARHLLTSHGLRTLSPDDSDYQGHYEGNQAERDEAYHQGTVWSWLLGPFVRAHIRVYEDLEQARTYLEPMLHHLADHGLGSVSEIFDGDPPFTPRGCIASAMSVAEVLRVWQATEVRS